MRKKNHHQNRWVLGFIGLAVAASWLLLANGPRKLDSEVASGRPRLVAIHPLPEMAADGAMCAWTPASAQETLLAMLQQKSAEAASTTDSAVGPRESLARPPIRVIKDPYPTYSAVAADPTHKEIVLQDENLFQIMAYDASTNTPASASLSEPKRIIGGHQTKVEFNCALYVDPDNGDIYSVNNDTVGSMVIFSREAKGDVPPTRELKTPHGTYGIAVDEGAQEMFLTVEHANSVVVYHKYAQGDDKPIRMIVGNKTQMADPHGITLDTKNGWVFVANYGNSTQYLPGEERKGGGGTGGQGRINGSGKFVPPSITVYPIKTDGDVPPLRTIQGPKTQLNWPGHIKVDEDSGLLYVANDGGNSVLVFKETDNGNVEPTRVIKGPLTQIKNPTGISLDKKAKEIIVANMGNHRATVFPMDANGNVAPKRVIRSAPAELPALQIGNPGAVSYDTTRDQILVPN